MKNHNNIYNFSKGKTKSAIDYIENLEPLPTWDFKQDEMLDKHKKLALQANTANEMLEAIKYNPKYADGIYNIINKMKKWSK